MEPEKYRFKDLFSLQGRLDRSSYIFGLIIPFALYLLVGLILILLETSGFQPTALVKTAGYYGFFIIYACWLWYVSAIAVHRLHDMNLPSAYYWAAFILVALLLLSQPAAFYLKFNTLYEVVYTLGRYVLGAFIFILALLMFFADKRHENEYGIRRSFMNGTFGTVVRSIATLILLIFIIRVIFTNLKQEHFDVVYLAGGILLPVLGLLLVWNKGKSLDNTKHKPEDSDASGL